MVGKFEGESDMATGFAMFFESKTFGGKVLSNGFLKLESPVHSLVINWLWENHAEC